VSGVAAGDFPAKGGTYVPILHRQRSAHGRECDLDGRINRAGGEEVASKSGTKGEAMRLVDSILMEIDQEAQTTKRVLDRIPEDRLAWKPRPKSYSLGQLALHIASLPGSGAAAAALDTMEAPSFHSRSSTTARKFWTLSPRASRARRILR
jgi:hypothetical protein